MKLKVLLGIGIALLLFGAWWICTTPRPDNLMYSEQQVGAIALSYLGQKDYFYSKEITEVKYLGDGIWQINYCPTYEQSVAFVDPEYPRGGCSYVRFHEKTRSFR